MDPSIATQSDVVKHQESGKPAKRARTAQRVRQSCSSCRKSKVKCSGIVPCERCVRQGKAGTCTLWHRPSGRPPLPTRKLRPMGDCPFYSDLLERIACKLAGETGILPEGVHSCVEQASRMFMMIGLKERSIRAMYAGTRLAMAAGVEIEDLMLDDDDLDSSNTGSVLGAVSDSSPWSSAEIGIGAAQWLSEILPTVPAPAKTAVDWVNQLFDEPMSGWDSSSLYEVRTVVRGSIRFGELRSSVSQCIDQCSDQQLLVAADQQPAAITANTSSIISDGEGTAANAEFNKKSRGKILDQLNFRKALEESFQAQFATLAASKSDDCTVLRFEHKIPIQVSDLQGRTWAAAWEDRTCMAERGEFVHSARKMHSWLPVCERAKVLVSHLMAVGEQVQQQGPVVVSFQEEEKSNVATGAMAEMRDDLSDVLELLFDFDELDWVELEQVHAPPSSSDVEI